MKPDWSERYGRISVLRTLIIAAVLTSGFAIAGAQQPKKDIPPLRERLFYGGGLGLQFGTVTNIELSPIIGLWVLPRVGIAAGPTYTYYKDPYFHTSIYGGRTYAELIILQDFNNIIPIGVHLGLFLHGEYEVLSLETALFKGDPQASGRFLTNTFLAGGGISQPLGQRSSLNLTFLWAVNDPGYSIYGSPEFRVSFIF
jgi:hypothetical protein